MTEDGAYSNNADQLRTLKHKQCHEKCPDFTVSSEWRDMVNRDVEAWSQSRYQVSTVLVLMFCLCVTSVSSWERLRLGPRPDRLRKPRMLLLGHYKWTASIELTSTTVQRVLHQYLEAMNDSCAAAEGAEQFIEILSSASVSACSKLSSCRACSCQTELSDDVKRSGGKSYVSEIT